MTPKDKNVGSLERLVEPEALKQASTKKVGVVDTLGNITYSLITGTILDVSAGLNLAGIAASRLSGTAINTITGMPYGWWREQTYKVTHTTEESGKLRKTLVELLSFNTFQVPVYATALTIGSFVSNLLQGEVKVDWEKVEHGATYLAIISPILGPTMGWYMNGFRKLFGVKSAAAGAYKRE